MKPNKEESLKINISDLPFTDDLKKLLQFNKLTTLKEVLNIEVHNWHNKLPGFTYHYQHEIISYLQKSDLVEYLKED